MLHFSKAVRHFVPSSTFGQSETDTTQQIESHFSNSQREDYEVTKTSEGHSSTTLEIKMVHPLHKDTTQKEGANRRLSRDYS